MTPEDIGQIIAIKLIDKSLVLGKVTARQTNSITIADPFSVTQMFNPRTGEQEVGMIPMDLIFVDAAEGKKTVTLKNDHVMYEKDLNDFPSYLANYKAQVSGITAVADTGIVSA